jgi:hypothetical protein
MRENDELLVLHRAYEESVQDGIFGESEKEYWGVRQAITYMYMYMGPLALRFLA